MVSLVLFASFIKVNNIEVAICSMLVECECQNGEPLIKPCHILLVQMIYSSVVERVVVGGEVIFETLWKGKNN